MGKISTVAQLEDVDLAERLFLKGYPFYKYAPNKNNPASLAVSPLKKPISQCTVALITTAGLSLPNQPPFDVTIKMGDSSFRELPGNISPQSLEMNQRSWSFDKTGILRDRNLALPLDRLRELQVSGEIGAVAPYHFSFMGSIVGPRKLMQENAPEVARRLVAAGVDVALLTPV